jgi:alkylated DNA repair dioxygenase AlkB
MAVAIAGQVSMSDADVTFYREFFGQSVSDTFYQMLLNETEWQPETIRLWGRTIPLPRLTAWYGDGLYTYSGITMHPRPWTKALLEIKHKVEEPAGTRFNSVLLNLYRNERDSVSWHSDDEPELGVNPIIGSVSFGATELQQVLVDRWRAEGYAEEIITTGRVSSHVVAGFWLHTAWLWAEPLPNRFLCLQRS